MTHPLCQRFPEREGSFKVYFHRDCLLHAGPREHPERPERLRAILDGCLSLPTDTPVSYIEPTPATFEQLLLAHDRNYLNHIEESVYHKSEFMSPDNYLCFDSFEAIRAAGGCACAAGESLLRGEASFSLIRPPGHHAGRATAEGFCFINHAALTIETVRQTRPDSRFLVVDFDVHHGNGIDRIYQRDGRVFYYSIHGNPAHIYPHSGFPEERGDEAGHGFTRNVSVDEGTRGDAWLELFRETLSGVEAEFSPDFLIVSAGFDAHEEDPFGVMHLHDQHYVETTAILQELAAKHCAGRAAWLLEGGYSTTVLGRLIPRIITRLAGPV